jgi:hypothetical protein
MVLFENWFPYFSLLCTQSCFALYSILFLSSDPYCIFGFVFPGTKIHQFPNQTSIRPRTLNPIWKEKHKNSVVYHFMQTPTETFLIIINDEDTIGKDDPMGEVSFKVSDLGQTPKGQKEFHVQQGYAQNAKKGGYGTLLIEWEFQYQGCESTCSAKTNTFTKSNSGL